LIASLHLYLDYTIGIFNTGGFAEHCFRAAVACLGKPDGPFHGCRLDVMAGDNVFNADFDEHLWMFFGSYALHMHFVAGHVLAFFAQDRNEISFSICRVRGYEIVTVLC